jgi:hypothetical protein
MAEERALKQNLYREWMIRLQMFLAARPRHGGQAGSTG